MNNNIRKNTNSVFDKLYIEYDEWFIKNKFVYESELAAIKSNHKFEGKTLEIGIGSGQFAKRLNIKYGTDLSFHMLKQIPESCIIKNTISNAELLPYKNDSFDNILMITTICFIKNIKKALFEVCRVSKTNGNLVIGFVDKNSELGKKYLNNKEKSRFYKEAFFYSTDEIIELLKKYNFNKFKFSQTLFNPINYIKKIEIPIPGYNKGSFVVISAKK